jgi:hypothetical protein
MSNKTYKWPLLITAAIVVVRVISEQIGAPESVNFVFGVVWLYFIVPFYFASVIVRGGFSRPYLELFKNLLWFSVFTRLMVIPTYWLAYLFQWPALRFQLDAGGVVGEGVTPLFGYLIYPALNGLSWVIFAVLVGMFLGSITLFVQRRKMAQVAAAAELLSLALFGSRFW